MKVQFNYFFIILLWFSFNVTMEQPPLTPRTQAIIVLHQKLKDHEETISLLCQARNQDIQLAQLKEKKQQEKLEELRRELQLTKFAITQSFSGPIESPLPPVTTQKTSILLLRQMGTRGVLIAQAIITRHYVCQSLQALIKKANVRPQIKTLLSEAAPEVSTLVASGITWGTPVIASKISQFDFLPLKSAGLKAWVGMRSAVETVKGKAVFAWNSCIESMVNSLEKELSMQVYLRLSRLQIGLNGLSKRKAELIKSSDYSIHAEKEVKRIDDQINRVKEILDSINLNRKLAGRNKATDYLKLSELEAAMKDIDTHITVFSSFLPELKNAGRLTDVSRVLLELSLSATVHKDQELEHVGACSEALREIPSPKILYKVQEEVSSKQSCECNSCLNRPKQNAMDSVVEFTFQLPEDIELDTILASTLEDLEVQDRKRESQIQQIS